MTDCLLVTPWTVVCQAPLSMGFRSKNTGVCCHFLFWGISLTQESNLHLLHLLQRQAVSLHQSQLGSTNWIMYLYKTCTSKTFLFVCVCVNHSVVSSSVTPCDPVALQAPPCMEFSRQEYWSGLPCPSPGDLPNPGIEPRSPDLQANSLPSKLPGKPLN